MGLKIGRLWVSTHLLVAIIDWFPLKGKKYTLEEFEKLEKGIRTTEEAYFEAVKVHKERIRKLRLLSMLVFFPAVFVIFFAFVENSYHSFLNVALLILGFTFA